MLKGHAAGVTLGWQRADSTAMMSGPTGINNEAILWAPGKPPAYAARTDHERPVGRLIKSFLCSHLPYYIFCRLKWLITEKQILVPVWICSRAAIWIARGGSSLSTRYGRLSGHCIASNLKPVHSKDLENFMDSANWWKPQLCWWQQGIYSSPLKRNQNWNFITPPAMASLISPIFVKSFTHAMLFYHGDPSSIHVINEQGMYQRPNPYFPYVASDFHVLIVVLHADFLSNINMASW